MDDKGEVNLKIDYDIKLSRSGEIYHVIGHMTNHVIIKFHDITCTQIFVQKHYCSIVLQKNITVNFYNI